MSQWSYENTLVLHIQYFSFPLGSAVSEPLFYNSDHFFVLYWSRCIWESIEGFRVCLYSLSKPDYFLYHLLSMGLFKLIFDLKQCLFETSILSVAHLDGLRFLLVVSLESPVHRNYIFLLVCHSLLSKLTACVVHDCHTAWCISGQSMALESIRIKVIVRKELIRRTEIHLNIGKKLPISRWFVPVIKMPTSRLWLCEHWEGCKKHLPWNNGQEIYAIPSLYRWLFHRQLTGLIQLCTWCWREPHQTPTCLFWQGFYDCLLCSTSTGVFNVAACYVALARMLSTWNQHGQVLHGINSGAFYVAPA